MKYIQIKYLELGKKRTVDLNMSGFMGPAKSPMGKGPLLVNGEYLTPGTLTSAFRLRIPPGGECQVVDCQANRERLREATKEHTRWDDVKVYDEKTGQYNVERKEITIPPAFVVLDDTPIHEDVITDNPLGETEEVRALKAKIAELEKKEDFLPPPQ